MAGLFQLGYTVSSSGETPGPSAALFNSPYYTATNNLYVATTGSDTTGTGSIGNPWATLQKANDSVPTAGTVINVAPGTYSAGVTVTHGGSSASSTGYVVYRSTTLGGAIITDSGSSPQNACLQSQDNYVMFDGFTLQSSTQQTFGTGSTVYHDGTFNLTQHHVWILNCTISGYGQGGIQYNEGEWFYSIHNRIFNCCRAPNDDSGPQGSGISYANEILVPGYTLTADDQNNKVTGNTGSLFRNFIMWNDIYNNVITDVGNQSSDGNGIILDTYNWSGTGGSSVPYTGGTLVAFNAVYNNGGSGIHIFNSEYATVCNNSVYNNNLDTTNLGTARGGIDTNLSYGNTIFNNISYAIGGSGVLANNTAMGVFGQISTTSTTLNGAITNSQTSIVLTSTSAFPGGASGPALPTSTYALPGVNVIQCGSELMLVTAGWGTTTLTVTRGYGGTTAASHTSGSTVTWTQDYWTNNVTKATGAGATDISGPFNGEFYSTTTNKTASDPLWVAVGNVTTGSTTTKPNGANFALQSGSPAIGFGLTQTWLPAAAADCGCAFHTITQSP